MDLNYAEIIQQPIKKIYKIFSEHPTENVINILRHKLELEDDEKFSIVCISLLVYDEKKIFHGTLAFSIKLISGEIHTEDKKGVWPVFVKNQKIDNVDIERETNEQYPVEDYKKMDPFYNEKIKVCNEMKVGRMDCPVEYKDKIGKFVVVDDNIPYLPYPSNELWMYDKYPLYGEK